MKLSIVLPVSRPESTGLIASNLNSALVQSHEYELITVFDNKFIDPNRFFDQLDLNPFTRHEFAYTNRGKPPSHSIPRRDRIANVHNVAKEMLGDTDVVFSFEDDTVLPPNALTRLLRSLGEGVGLVSGIEVGRHINQYLGAWHIKGDPADPHYYESLLDYKSRPVVKEVDATGFYCFVTPTELYKSVEHQWKMPLGPDVFYGLELRRRGLKNLINTNLACGHKHREETLYPHDQLKQWQISKRAENWKMRCVDQKLA